MSKRVGLAVIATIALSLAGSSGASAGVTFTWDPGNVGLGANPNSFTANNIVVSDFANIAVNNNTGDFNETGVLIFQGFQNVGLGVLAPGFTNVTAGSGYGFYVTFTASGNQGGGIPSVGSSVTGIISSLNYTLYGSVNGAIGITTLPNNDPTPNNNTGAIQLATGSLVGVGTTTLTNSTTGGLSPKADVLVSMTAAAGASSFFVAPPASALDLLLGDFSVTASITTTADPNLANTTDLIITGGGGNLLATVPEPASILVFSSGLVMLGFLGARRRAA